MPHLEGRSQVVAFDAQGPGLARVRLEVERATCRDPFGPGTAAPLRRLVIAAYHVSAHEAGALIAIARTSLGLDSEELDLLTVGLHSLGLALPGAPASGSPAVVDGDTVATAARKALRRQSYKMRANLEGTVRDLDPEYLHDLRVATRRARAALRVFAAVVRPSSRVARRNELAWIAGLLGAVRDRDVLLARFHGHFERAGVPEDLRIRLDAAIGGQRNAAREPLVAALRSRRFARLLADLDAGRGVVRGGRGARPAREAGVELIARALRRVRQVAGPRVDNLDDTGLHALRIAFKRLRYTCEFLAELYGDEAREAIASLARVQDCLGRHQDAVVALGVLSSLAPGVLADGRDAPGTAVALGALMQVQREEAATSRREFVVTAAGADKALSRLRRAIVLP
ncbi:MAG: CHAD domain-containing protein [Acidobacteriota bacterium]